MLVAELLPVQTLPPKPVAVIQEVCEKTEPAPVYCQLPDELMTIGTTINYSISSMATLPIKVGTAPTF